MKIYLVGGAVRDELLGLPVGERDWVVVGADEAQMRELGFIAADKSFPVFLHPQTGEEYALARRETKQGAGYRGFEVYAGPEVGLEEDLRRRDLTINAMARDGEGRIIDPYGGQDDLAAGVLRHVSPAFVEDPLRVLRAARFAATLGSHGFRVAHATHRLMCQMVDDGEMAHLRPERLWREMVRAMQATQPWRFFEVLHRCGALRILITPLAMAMGEAVEHQAEQDSPPIAALRRAALATTDTAVRLAATLMGCVETEAGVDRLAAAIRADRDTAQLLRRALAGRELCGRLARGDEEALFELVARWRGMDPDSDIARVAAVCDAQYAQPLAGPRLAVALPAARGVSAADLRAQGLGGAELGRRLVAARREAMHAALQAEGLVP